MENIPRKASDVLLDLEKKIDAMLDIIRAQDLNIKILSNKISSLIDGMGKSTSVPQFTAETSTVPTSRQSFMPDLERQIPISSEDSLPLEMSPKGFRRTSRPETYSGDNDYLNRPKNVPIQDKAMEIIIPNESKQQTIVPDDKKASNHGTVQNAIPVMQRVVDGNGKSLFLSDVEIINLNTMTQVAKTRTNGTGKWMASLEAGIYRVVIRKVEKLTGSKKETLQEINVDGNKSPLELQTIIIR